MRAASALVALAICMALCAASDSSSSLSSSWSYESRSDSDSSSSSSSVHESSDFEVNAAEEFRRTIKQPVDAQLKAQLMAAARTPKLMRGEVVPLYVAAPFRVRLADAEKACRAMGLSLAKGKKTTIDAILSTLYLKEYPVLGLKSVVYKKKTADGKVVRYRHRGLTAAYLTKVAEHTVSAMYASSKNADTDVIMNAGVFPICTGKPKDIVTAIIRSADAVHGISNRLFKLGPTELDPIKVTQKAFKQAQEKEERALKQWLELNWRRHQINYTRCVEIATDMQQYYVDLARRINDDKMVKRIVARLDDYRTKNQNNHTITLPATSHFILPKSYCMDPPEDSAPAEEHAADAEDDTAADENDTAADEDDAADAEDDAADEDKTADSVDNAAYSDARNRIRVPRVVPDKRVLDYHYFMDFVDPEVRRLVKKDPGYAQFVSRRRRLHRNKE